MPVHVGIMCRTYEKVYFPDTDQIELHPSHGETGLCRLTFTCQTVRLFGERDMMPYSVSTYAYLRGFADRGHYQKLRRTA